MSGELQIVSLDQMETYYEEEIATMAITLPNEAKFKVMVASLRWAMGKERPEEQSLLDIFLAKSMPINIAEGDLKTAYDAKIKKFDDNYAARIEKKLAPLRVKSEIDLTMDMLKVTSNALKDICMETDKLQFEFSVVCTTIDSKLDSLATWIDTCHFRFTKSLLATKNVKSKELALIDDIMKVSSKKIMGTLQFNGEICRKLCETYSDVA